MKPYIKPQPAAEAPPEDAQDQPQEPKTRVYVKPQAKQVSYNTVLRVVA